MSLKTLLGLDSSAFKTKAGERVHVRPLTVKQAFVIEQCFGPIAAGILDRGVDDLSVYAEHADDLCKLVAVAVERDVAWVEALPRTDFNAILAKLLDVERDFFNALLMQAKVSRASPATGTTSSRA
jgi:hypothetical protein